MTSVVNHDFGCKLWINARVVYGPSKGQPLFFVKLHFCVIAADPRWLLVAVNALCRGVNVLVGRAPRSGCESTARASFWDAIGGLV
eukprot:9006382-Pyramimonas_sp.AAC.1